MQAVNQAGSATWDPGGGRQGPKADGGRKGGPQTAGDPDLPQTLGPSACAPYPSPMLSEEGELLLDSPALEVSDSESDEVLGAGPEGRGSEAGTWEQVGRAARRGAEAGRGGVSNRRWEGGRRTRLLKHLQCAPAPRALRPRPPPAVGPWAQASAHLSVPWFPMRTAGMTGRVSDSGGWLDQVGEGG